MTAFRTRIRTVARAAQTQIPAFADTGSDREHLDAAIDWLNLSQDVTSGCGSAATYNLVLGWEDPYPETSGYIVPTLYRYADRNPESDAFERATAMAEWLCSVQHPQGSIPEGTGETGDPNVFNTGQVVFGLVEAYRRTGTEQFKAATRDACDWLVEIQDDSGAWTAFDYKGDVHTYTTRVAWALLEGATVVDERADRYREAAENNLRWAVGKRRSNGWFEDAAFTSDADPYLHTIAYTIRGLLSGSALLNDDSLWGAAKESADVLLELQQQEGQLKGAYDEQWSPSWYYCLTGNAQMALIWLQLYEATNDREYLLAARSTAEFLKRHQPLTGPDPVRGGVPGSYPHVGRYLFLRYPNWAVKFFADLLLELQTVSPPARPAAETGDRCRVCLLFDGEYTEQWVKEAIEQMLSETDAEITLVVINEDAGLLGSENVKRGRKYPAYAAFWLASKLVSGLTEGEAYDNPVHISDITDVADATWIRTYPTAVSGLWKELPSEVVDEVRSSADLVFRRGFGLVRGDILTATEYGVLSYHHGDPRAYRGGPAGFWEFMHDEETAGMIVQSLSDDLDAGTIQAHETVNIHGCQSWSEIKRKLYTESTGLLAEAVETVQDDTQDPMIVEDLGPVYHPPSAAELSTFSLKRLRNAMA
ncbi:hypothetical protein [Halovenus marina]|uniref:hypothetical protein n=1 Tax=Halovenus marina TaxID=3396621 RepID=UPI003F57C783